MALVDTDETINATEGFNGLSAVRQIALLLGLAVSISLGIGIVFWAQEPDYRPLYSNIDKRSSGAIIASLEQLNIDYKINPSTGAILVPNNKVQELRLNLASQGIASGAHSGFEMLNKKQGFGTSQFMEMARFRHALEGELARTISSFVNIHSARVHIAIPKRSAFIRDKATPSASVFVDLMPGQSLGKKQVSAVVNIVASSIPNMSEKDVTVVDQKGDLLTTQGEDSLSATSHQLDVKQQIERDYVNRIMTMLTPILGSQRVKAQVSTDIDFTVVETTAETFNPDVPAIRSMQKIEEQRGESKLGKAGGVPGALTNTPPNTEKTTGDAETAVGPNGQIRRRETHNYELDKTISHTRGQPWHLRKISVAVAIDDKITKNDKGEEIRTPLSKEELERITLLVRDAVGFDAVRGDRVNVINVGFAKPEKIADMPEPPIWDQDWFMMVIKYILSGIFILALVFGVLKPVLRSLATRQVTIHEGGDSGPLQLADDSFSLGGGGSSDNPIGDLHQLSDASVTHGPKMETIKNMVRENPGQVAQVVMNWVGDEDE